MRVKRPGSARLSAGFHALKPRHWGEAGSLQCAAYLTLEGHVAAVQVELPAPFASGAVVANVGDYILATEGRIVGVGPDLEELHRQFVEPNPELQNIRMLAYFVPELDS